MWLQFFGFCKQNFQLQWNSHGIWCNFKICLHWKGQKFVPGQCHGIHEKGSVLSCISTSGTCLPHLFIYKPLSGKFPQYVTNGAEESTMFQGQKSGWMSKDIYLTWFKEQFLKFALAERPLLLLFDGLKVHVTIELIRAAKESQILLYCLSAHSSHFLQPLDLSVFGLLKSEWKRWPTHSIILLAI